MSIHDHRVDTMEAGSRTSRPKSTPPDYDNRLVHFIRMRFSRLYALLAAIIFLVALVLLLTMVLFIMFNRLADKHEEHEKRMQSESEKFMVRVLGM